MAENCAFIEIDVEQQLNMKFLLFIFFFLARYSSFGEKQNGMENTKPEQTLKRQKWSYYISVEHVYIIFSICRKKNSSNLSLAWMCMCVCGGSLSLSTRHARDAKTNTNGCALDQLIPISTISAPNFSHDSMKYQEKILFFCEFFFFQIFPATSFR